MQPSAAAHRIARRADAHLNLLTAQALIARERGRESRFSRDAGFEADKRLLPPEATPHRLDGQLNPTRPNACNGRARMTESGGVLTFEELKSLQWRPVGVALDFYALCRRSAPFGTAGNLMEVGCHPVDGRRGPCLS